MEFGTIIASMEAGCNSFLFAFGIFSGGIPDGLYHQLHEVPHRGLQPFVVVDAHIQAEVRNKYGRLTAENIEELKTFPALFMQEADGYYAKPSDEQQAYLGIVEDIRVQDNGIKIRWRIIWPIPMQQISRIGFELGMLNMTKAISELNHTHWAIKRINLFEELKDAGIPLFGFV